MPYIGNIVQDFSVSTAMLNSDSVTSIKVLDGTIVNADINDSAAIAGTKISPNFGSQNILTTGKLGVGTTSLNNVFPITVQAEFPGIQFLDAQGTDSFGINADAGVLKLQVGVGGSSPTQVLQIATASTTITNNLNANAGIDVTGAITGTGDVTITKASPVLRLADSTDPQGTNGSIGKIEFFGNDGSSGGVDVRSFIQTISTNSTGNAHALVIGLGESNNAPTEKIRILDGGNVGIGTTSPQSLLEVNGANDAVLGISLGIATSSLTVSRYIGITQSGNATNLAVNSGFQGIEFGGPGSASEGYLAFHTHDVGVNSGERVRITKGGQVGIGTDSPGSLLSISGANDAVTGISLGNASTAITTSRYIGFTDINNNANLGTNSGFQGIEFGGPGSASEGYLAFHTHDAGVQSAERLRIDKSGQTLIGTATSNNSARLQVTTPNQVVATFEGTGVSDPQIYLGDDMSNPTNNAIIFGYDKADNRGYLTIGGDADTTLTISDGSLVGINTSANVEHFNVAGNIRLINPTGTTRRINALPSGTYTTGVSGGAAICFQRISDGGGGSDEIFFETHHQGVSHEEACRITKQGNLKFPNGHGIDFSATSGTGSSELFDDYEEGNFTPSFTQGVSGGSYSSQNGHYTKVGRLVMFSCRIDGNGLSANGDNLLLGGLPFTTVASGGTAGGAYFAFSDNFFSSSSGTNLAITIIVNNNATVCEFHNGDGTQLKGNDMNDVNRNIHIIGTYHAA